MTISVTVCSTWSRVFISRKYHDPSPASRPSTVPAPVYDTAFAASTAIAPMRARSSGETAGDGVSSTIFWWRRWMLQSRSPRWMTFPWVSASTCTSMWRGSSR